MRLRPLRLALRIARLKLRLQRHHPTAQHARVIQRVVARDVRLREPRERLPPPLRRRRLPRRRRGHRRLKLTRR